MQWHSTTNQHSHDLIMVCSESVKALAWRFARSLPGNKLEYDDLYSVGMLAVCEVVASGRYVRDLVPYLVKSARFAMIDEWRAALGLPSISLDAPLSSSEEAENFTLYDVLPAPAAAPAPADPSETEHELEAAVSRLPDRQRVALAERYGLPGVGLHSREEVATVLGCSPEAVSALSWRARQKLAGDELLLEVVGVAHE